MAKIILKIIYTCLLYIIHFVYEAKTKNTFTYDKFKSIKLEYSTFYMYSQVSLNLFTFLMNTTNKEIQLTDGELCFMKVPIDLIVYKEPIKKSVI